MRLRLLGSTLLFSALLFSVAPMPALAAPPDGAQHLDGADLKTVNGVSCGRIGGRWLPGRILEDNFFLSHKAALRSVNRQLKHAKGAKKAKLLKQANALEKKIKTQTLKCNAKSGKAVKFNLKNAMGLALRPKAAGAAVLADGDTGGDDSGTDLLRVNEDGSLENAVTSGSPEVSRFLIAPNGKLYVLFKEKTQLTADGPSCLIAEVAVSTGTPTCIESDLVEVDWEARKTLGRNDPIQFDSEGAIYYVGRYDSNGSQAETLRRYLDAETEDVINDNITIDNFLVQPDGTIFLAGATLNTTAKWIRRLSTAGELTTLVNNQRTSFIKQFPDGNIYLAYNGGTGLGSGVKRFLTESGSLDPQWWLTDTTWAADGGAHFTTASYCTGDPVHEEYPGFCAANGSYVTSFLRTLNDRMYVIAATDTQASGTVWRYYPTLAPLTTSVTEATHLLGLANDLLIAGVDGEDHHHLVFHDPSDDTEVELLSGQNIEIYHLEFRASDNAVAFDGLRFSDNKYVIGTVDLGTKEIRVAATGTVQLADFQLF